MKKITTFLLVCFSLVMSMTTQAQNKCCLGTTVAPEITTGFHATAIPGINNTPTPTLAVNASADLPNVEFIITKRNTPALMPGPNSTMIPDTTGGGGDVILGADIDGVFMPNSIGRYGIILSNGDTFDLTAVGYDLSLIRTLADSLLNGKSDDGSGTLTPCCSLFYYMGLALGQPSLNGFCDSVKNAGILNSTHIHGMNEILTIFDAFSTGHTSIPSVISTLQIINANGTFISPDCGGVGPQGGTGTNNFMPYGVNKTKKYGYKKDGTVGVQQLSDVSLFMMYPNPTTAGDVYVYFTTSKEVDLNINVYNALGQKVHSQTLGNVSGSFNTQIPAGNLTAGMYFVELTDGHSSQTHKLQVR